MENLIATLILYLCPDPDKMGYKLQNYDVSCSEYYLSDIYSKPKKYEKLLRQIHARN